MFSYKCNVCQRCCEKNHVHVLGDCWEMEVIFSIDSFYLDIDDSSDLKNRIKEFARQYKNYLFFGKYNGYGEIICKDFKEVRFFIDYKSIRRYNKTDLIFLIIPTCLSCYNKSQNIEEYISDESWFS